MYIDAVFDKKSDKILVSERHKDKRVLREITPDYTFYFKAVSGRYRSIFGDSLSKVVPKSYSEYHKLKKMYRSRVLFESDIDPVFRLLETEYKDSPSPEPNVAFFDIETDFDKNTGYSSPAEALNPITAISVHLQWINKTVCLAIPPKVIGPDTAQDIAKKLGNVFLFNSEKEMLITFLELIQDADILSGWNSEVYDIPYVVNRVSRLLGANETRKMCLWDMMPVKKTIKRGGKEEQTFNLLGRITLDYLQLYKKYTYKEVSSYSLDNISYLELGEKKVEYSGTLDQLYNNDFYKFLEYSIKDTLLLQRLDEKLQYIDLINRIAHENKVPIKTALGTVSMVEQAITVEAHTKGLKVPDKRWNSNVYANYNWGEHSTGDETTRAAGGWVKASKIGLVKWVGSSDLNSLYPSVIRAFNMSPETLVGQVNFERTEKEINRFVSEKKSRDVTQWWNDRFCILEMEDFFNNKSSDSRVTVDFENGKSETITISKLSQLIFAENSNLAITANGTIFRTDINGVIPSLLSKWAADRVKLQSTNRLFKNVLSGKLTAKTNKNLNTKQEFNGNLANIRNFNLDLLDEVNWNNDVEAENFLKNWGLYTDNSVFKVCESAVSGWKDGVDFWGKQQLVKKINLNSAYGGILNKNMKFFDKRIGQSTTLTGRCITKHMTAKTNEVITGVYDHNGESIVYNDTDSVYFSAWDSIKDKVKENKLEWDVDRAIAVYDEISKVVSDTFPEFLTTTFNIAYDKSKIIKSKREIVAKNALFLKKKRYACLVVDDEGMRYDKDGKPGVIKVTGLDLKRSDTPKFMQDFLRSVLQDVLTGHTEEEVIKKINEFKSNICKKNPWELGVPKAVNNLTHYKKKHKLNNQMKGRGQKMITIPGHVMGSLNWNFLREKFNDLNAMPIVDGQKVIFCYLKDNDYGFKNIAYPVDEVHLPEWFITLPFDTEVMVEKVVDKKLENLLSVLGWDLSLIASNAQQFSQLFEF